MTLLEITLLAITIILMSAVVTLWTVLVEAGKRAELVHRQLLDMINSALDA